MEGFKKYVVGNGGLYIGECDYRVPGNAVVEFNGMDKLIHNSKEYVAGNLRGAIKMGWMRLAEGEEPETDLGKDDPYQKKNQFVQEQAKKKYNFDQYDVDQSQAEDNVVASFKDVDKIAENSVYKKNEIVQTTAFKGDILQDDENQGETVGNVNDTLVNNEIKLPEGFDKFSKKQKEQFIGGCEDLKTLRYLKDKVHFATKSTLNKRLKELEK